MRSAVSPACRRTAGIGTSPLDLFRYAAPGTRQLGLGLPAYFSIDGGKTDLSNFDISSDPGDWARSNSGDSFEFGIVRGHRQCRDAG